MPPRQKQAEALIGRPRIHRSQHHRPPSNTGRMRVHLEGVVLQQLVEWVTDSTAQTPDIMVKRSPHGLQRLLLPLFGRAPQFDQLRAAVLSQPREPPRSAMAREPSCSVDVSASRVPEVASVLTSRGRHVKTPNKFTVVIPNKEWRPRVNTAGRSAAASRQPKSRPGGAAASVGRQLLKARRPSLSSSHACKPHTPSDDDDGEIEPRVGPAHQCTLPSGPIPIESSDRGDVHWWSASANQLSEAALGGYVQVAKRCCVGSEALLCGKRSAALWEAKCYCLVLLCSAAI